MKNIVFILLVFCSFQSSAQFQINNLLFTKGFTTDTATSISISVVSLRVAIDSKEQRPVFYLSFNSKSGGIIDDRNITYDELITSAKKAGATAEQADGMIQQGLAAILAGTKPQKLTAIRGLLNTYGIVLKPDTDQ